MARPRKYLLKHGVAVVGCITGQWLVMWHNQVLRVFSDRRSALVAAREMVG